MIRIRKSYPDDVVVEAISRYVAGEKIVAIAADLGIKNSNNIYVWYHRDSEFKDLISRSTGCRLWADCLTCPKDQCIYDATD